MAADNSAAIRNQLERILAHPVFRNSRRYPRFLAFVVEQTLSGRADVLRERSIGVEVFGRSPDYDTDTDHVVRSAAGEVRKRLAQYYVESEHQDELRIELRPGSYVPHFGKARGPSSVLARNSTPRSEGSLGGGRWRLPVLVALAAFVVLAFSLAPTGSRLVQSGLDRFWAPVLAGEERLLVCIGEPEPSIRNASLDGSSSADSAPLTQLTYSEFTRSEDQLVSLNDAKTLASLSGLLREEGKPFRVVGRVETNLRDLKAGPVLVVGTWSNRWVRYLTEDLRYQFEQTPDGRVVIRDDHDRQPAEWFLDSRTPFEEVTKDYAVVSRFRDENTGRMVVVVAGMGAFGTFAAGEFLTQAAQMEKLADLAPPNWTDANLQVVLSTEIIEGSPGPPRVEAVDTW